MNRSFIAGSLAAVLLLFTLGASPVVDPTSNAARMVPYDSRGQYAGQKVTYSGGTALKTAAAAGTTPFFSICGSSTKTVRVQRVLISMTTAAVQNVDIELIKTSTATSGGTATALTKVPHDSGSAASTVNLLNFYTAAPTAGAAVGVVNSGMVFSPATTAAAANSITPVDFDYRGQLEAEAPVLRGTAQCLEASMGTSLGVPTVTVSVVWTEE